ncbi:1-acyl-sn-glycerol-3-phosphate acyltransferase [Litoribacter alkaliphilus]|uniref:1-acyl-sn-glycerol-3-phosphate acyltransferase n=1 Tax=Litoribacter ruber TaxID=702568 RepID=A0AAP2CG52_9BACT|nr:1-acyl-sn-glycerol-3-phosphate acyltransferase [Litoribacter alkaliphilus]
MERKEKFIDIEKILGDKNPTLKKWLPSPILKYIKRIVHEKDINVIMNKHGHLQGLDFVDALIKEFGVEVELRGAENISLEKGVIFAANHPLGGLDGIAFMHVLGKYRKDIKFLVNDILTNIKNFESLFVPVNKHGSHGRGGVAAIEAAYSGDDALLVFPAGLVSRKQAEGIKDLEWKKSFISKAKKYKKTIIPVYIDGRNSGFFYNLARFRKMAGIKANVEMFYLADEMFQQRGKKVVIHIGKPVSYQHFDNTKNEKQWASEMRDRVYSMAQEK